jgi:hypothetical protein
MDAALRPCSCRNVYLTAEGDAIRRQARIAELEVELAFTCSALKQSKRDGAQMLLELLAATDPGPIHSIPNGTGQDARGEESVVRERALRFEIEAEHEKLREVHSELAAEARRLSAQVERVSEERDLARQELQVATERLRILEQVESGLKMELATLLKERNEMVQLRMEASVRQRSIASQVPRLSAALNLDEAREALTTDVLPG